MLDAEADVEKLRLDEKRGELEDLLKTAKESKRRGLEQLQKAFEEGRLSGAEFATALRTLLRPQFAALAKNQTNLGFRFTDNFMKTFTEFIDQASKLPGYLSIPGTIFAPAIDPSKKAKENAKLVAEAQAAVSKAISDTKTNTKKSADTLVLIHTVLKNRLPKPAKNGSRTTGNKPPTRSGVQYGLVGDTNTGIQYPLKPAN